MIVSYEKGFENMSRCSRLMRGIMLAAVLVAVVSTCFAAPTPPVAKIVPKIDTLFGVTRVDNYYWLREKSSPQVIDYLKAENAYTDSMTASTKDLQDKLYNEIVGRIKETDMSLPVKRDNYYYYSRDEKGLQYKIYCRKKGSLDAPEEVMLDVNKLAEGKTSMFVAGLQVSTNHELFAWDEDTTGNEVYTIHIKNLTTGEVLKDAVAGAAAGIVWANDNATLFYTTLDSALRPYRLWRHKLGTEQSTDAMVYQESDQKFEMSIDKAKSKAFIYVLLASEVTSETRFLDANTPNGELKVFTPRRQDVEYSVEDHGDTFFVLTNDKAKNFKLMETPVTATSESNWKEIIATSDSVKLDGMEVFKDYLVLSERVRGLTQLQVRNLTTGDNHFIAFDEPVYDVGTLSNPEYNTDVLRFAFQSMITPQAIYDYNMTTRKRTLMKQREVLGGYDPTQYQQERIFAKASDGVLVPIALVYKKGLVKNGNNPCFIEGYGAYGISSDPWFSSGRLSLLDRGFVFAIAQVRGGGEMGRVWYDNGKYFNKKNTFTDFIACAETLIDQKFTNKDKIAINGGSAGGLLIGAVTNMRPDLFKVVVADVPFVDVINTMLDSTLPLTVIEYEEWGNPHKKDFFDYMLSYSPYDNVKPQAYPDMLITAGLNDPRVSYWEPAKWTAMLRATKTDNHMLLLKTRMDSGHMGVSGRYSALKDVAFMYAFILDRLGMAK
jgi:oligopeptidase B